RLEGLEAILVGRINELLVDRGGRVIGNVGCAAIEEAAAVELALEDGMAKLHVGDGHARVSFSVLLFADLLRRRHPAIALAEDADEERLGAVDPLLAISPGIGAFTID